MAALRTRAVLAAATAAAFALGACDLAPLPSDEPTDTSPTPTALGSEPPDPRVEALAASLADLRRTVAAAREALEAARTTAGGDGAEAAASAVSFLAAREELAEGEPPPGIPPLFPGPASSREQTIDYGDVFTETLTQARAAGNAGAPVVDLLRDPVAGDVGVWQRDAAGMLDEVEDAARASGDVAAAEAAVAELPGEATKALAWAMLAADARDDDTRAAFAERGVAHLDLVLAAIDDLTAEQEG